MTDEQQPVQVQISRNAALALISVLAGIVLVIVTLVTTPLSGLGAGFWVGFLVGIAGVAAGLIAIHNGHKQVWVIASTVFCGVFLLTSIVVMMAWGTVDSKLYEGQLDEILEDRGGW